MQTVLPEIELISNSQPLGVSYENNVEPILSLNHLFFSNKLNVQNISGKFDTNRLTDLNCQVKYINNLLNPFWNPWR